MCPFWQESLHGECSACRMTSVTLGVVLDLSNALHAVQREEYDGDAGLSQETR